MVRHHRRERDCRDDHHRGGAGEPAKKGQDRQPVASFHQRQGQHEKIRVRTRGQQIEAKSRNRQHEEAHQQEITGKGPGGGAQVVLVFVLYHHHLKHARQAQQGHCREHGKTDPAGAGHLEARNPGGLDPLECARDAPRQPPDNEHPHREQRAELDHGFHRDGHDHAVMALVGVEIAGAEQDGEKRQPDRHPKRGGLHVGQGGGRRIGFGEGGKGQRDRLQLQRDIWRGGNHREHRHQHRQQVRLAVA